MDLVETEESGLTISFGGNTMRRRILVAAVAALVIAGCGKSDEQDKEVQLAMPTSYAGVNKPMIPPPAFVPPPDIVVQTDAPNALFSLKHSLTVAMAHDAVAPRYQAARDACLKDKALKCVLTSASLTTGLTVRGELQVALPHEQVAAFEMRLMHPMREDGGAKPDITSRATSVENQTQRVADTERQLSQAVAYRDKLEELSKRANLTVEEALKLHEALTEAQTAVENATAAKRAAQSDVRLEQVDVTLEERVVPVETSALAGFWKNAGRVFMASLAEMLLRIVNALPWLPLALALAWVAARLVKRLRFKRGS
jgi:hypothetical protein